MYIIIIIPDVVTIFYIKRKMFYMPFKHNFKYTNQKIFLEKKYCEDFHMLDGILRRFQTTDVTKFTHIY